MPHLTIEYTKSNQAIDSKELMQEAHCAAMSTGLFTEQAIKVRTKVYDTALIGGKLADFAHLTIYLIEGRDDATKKKLTETLHQMLSKQFEGYSSISVDARDLEKAIYTKSTK